MSCFSERDCESRRSKVRGIQKDGCLESYLDRDMCMVSFCVYKGHQAPVNVISPFVTTKFLIACPHPAASNP